MKSDVAAKVLQAMTTYFTLLFIPAYIVYHNMIYILTVIASFSPQSVVKYFEQTVEFYLTSSIFWCKNLSVSKCLCNLAASCISEHLALAN